MEQVVCPKMSKLSKKMRKEIVLDALVDDRYNRYALAKELHVHERTIRRYVNEIAQQLGDPHEERMKILRAKCLSKLTSKVHHEKLADDLMVKLLISGEPRRLETQSVEEIRELKIHIIKIDEEKVRREHSQ